MRKRIGFTAFITEEEMYRTRGAAWMYWSEKLNSMIDMIMAAAAKYDIIIDWSTFKQVTEHEPRICALRTEFHVEVYGVNLLPELEGIEVREIERGHEQITR